MEEKEYQVSMCALEELYRRKNLIYKLKNIMWRKYGWFKKWSDDVDKYYKSKYPLIYKETHENNNN